MYEEDGFCPDVNYRQLAALQFLLLVVFLSTSVVYVFLAWSEKSRISVHVRLGGLNILSGVLCAPATVGRVFWPRPLLLESVCFSMFFLGLYVHFYTGGIFLQQFLQRSLRGTQVIFPEKFARYVRWIRWILLLNSAIPPTLQVLLMMRLHAAQEPAQRIQFITRYFGVVFVQAFFYIVVPAVIAYRERRLVENALPAGTPEVFTYFLERKRIGLVIKLATFLLGFILACAIFLVENWQKHGGLLYLYVVFPIVRVCQTIIQTMAAYGLRKSFRKHKERTRVLALSRHLHVSELIETGSRELAASPLSCIMAPPVWERGVSCALLQGFISSCHVPDDLSTFQVVEAKIKPITKPSKCSAWEAIYTSSPAGESKLIGASTVFVSHSWSNNFSSLAAILERHAAKPGSTVGNTFFFLDAFCMSQHALTESAARVSLGLTLLEQLRRAVEFPGRMVMVLEPWHHPNPLTRCWCLYELYLACATDSQVSMAFSARSEKRIYQSLTGNLALAGDIAHKLDVRQATATMDTDRRMIFAAIEAEIGIDHFVDMVTSKLSEGLYLAILGPLFLTGGAEVVEPKPTVQRRTLQMTAAPSNMMRVSPSNMKEMQSEFVVTGLLEQRERARALP